MIINNYIDNLPENKRSDLDFHSIANPTLNIRIFEYNLVRDETHLVLPYYVGDYSHKDYVDENFGPTFTTVFIFDEDTVPQDQVRVVKKTTYAGEQIIDLGTFDEEGVHSLSIYTIQNNGVSSATKFLQFIVRKPESEYTVVDLANSSGFTSNVINFKRYATNQSDGGMKATVYTRSYEVAYNGNNDIYVTVRRPQNNPWHSVYPVSDEVGTLGDQVSDDSVPIDYELIKNSGYEVTYHLTDRCVVGGEEKLLKDYVGYMDAVPEEVIRTGVENKIALMYLFEAAKAADVNNPVKFIMPEMDIVCDYHFLDITKSINNLSSFETIAGSILLPDNIVIDLNKSSIYLLPTTNSYSSKLIQGFYNIDTHIINGKIVGNWGNAQFVGGSDGEHRSAIIFEACRFCSIENLDISRTVGYDAFCGANYQGDATYGKFVFNNLSYINYNGELHQRDFQDSQISGYRLSTTAHNVTSPNWVVCAHTFMISKDGVGSYGVTDKIHTKTCRTVFLHFYDANDTFIKTVKALQQWNILVPYGASKVKISAYGILESSPYSADSDSPDVLCAEDGSRRRWIIYRANVPSWGCCTDNCAIHDTRMVVLLIGGVQNRIKNCTLWNIAGERQSAFSYRYSSSEYDATGDTDSFPIYKLLMDCEESARFSFHTFYENLDCLYSDSIHVKTDGGYDSHYKNCHNLHFALSDEFVDYLIEGCSGKINRAHTWLSGPSHSVIRNCILKDITNGNDGIKQSNCFGAGQYPGDLYLRNCDVTKIYGAIGGLVHNCPYIKS